MKYIVKFENADEPFWLAPWRGDPGRTIVEENAERFPTRDSAERALRKARKDWPNRRLEGKIIEVSL